MKVTDYVADYLSQRGVKYAFYLIGGMITHLVDSLHQSGKVRTVTMHHEQGAAFAAEGMARMTGVPGVAMATSGPGAVNLLTGIGSCFFDSTPAVFLTGQVNRSEMRGARAIRQLGFQETDIVAMAAPITKGAWLARTPEEVPALLHRAFELALCGRPGPVLIDLPMDVQRAEINAPNPVEPPSAPNAARVRLDDLVADLERARSPLVLAGGGIRASGTVSRFRQFVERLGVPVVHSLHGVDLLPYNHPLRVGMIGTYGNRWANLALGRADLVVVLGSRLDVRQTGADTASFGKDKIIHHVDVEAGEINNRILGCRAHVASLPEFFGQALARLETLPIAQRAEWVSEIAALRRQWPDTDELVGFAGINPNRAMHVVAAHFPHAAAFVVDVGNHQMWSAQSLRLGDNQRFLTSGGMGSMGFALPAAIGAAFASRASPVVVIAGDGGFQCNIQELQTIVRNRLDVKMFVVDNGSLGMVRQFQASYFESRCLGTIQDYSAPDFATLAQAYGIPGRTVRDAAELEDAIRWLAGIDGPGLVRIVVSEQMNAYPKIAFGRPITEMEPYATPLDIEGT
jgi:acetolactate synthase-1/2/3 large subunit